MTQHLIKNIAGIAILFIAGTPSFANPGTNPGDTAQKIQSSENFTVLQEPNVKFPAIFSGNEEETIDYIEKFSVNRKAYLQRTYQRSKKFFPKVTSILKKYNVPQEFKVLLALESGFNGDAISSAGAVGYWQIMDDVAKEYGLKIASNQKRDRKKTSGKKKGHKAVIDERTNFQRSTHVAARYLKDRCRNLNNDWLLIAASYNWGVGNVWNAMEKTGKANPTFWDIKKYVPAETRAYVMNFITLNVIFYNYEKFAESKLCFKPVTVESSEPEFEISDQDTSLLY
jgi:soluble lytic murein transglycosylase-like protein